MNPVLLFGIGAAILGGKRKKRRPKATRSTRYDSARYAAELARKSGGNGKRVSLDEPVTGAKYTAISFHKYPSGATTELEAPKDSKTPVADRNLDTILIPSGWWDDAKEAFLKADGDRHERVGAVMEAAFGDASQDARDGKAFLELQDDLLTRGESWMKDIRDDTEKIEVKEDKPAVEIVKEDDEDFGKLVDAKVAEK